MTAVFSEPSLIAQCIEEMKLSLVIANLNSPKQVVISGHDAEMVQLEERLQQESIRFTRLPVSTAFHSDIVASAVEPFKNFLDEIDFKKPAIPVLSNRTAKRFPNDLKRIKSVIAEQIAKPIRFADEITTLVKEGVDTFVEVGPGNVLSGLVKQCEPEASLHIIATDVKGQDGVLSLLQAIGQLAVLGIELDYTPLWDGYEPPRTTSRI